MPAYGYSQDDLRQFSETGIDPHDLDSWITGSGGQRRHHRQSIGEYARAMGQTYSVVIHGRSEPGYVWAFYAYANGKTECHRCFERTAIRMAAEEGVVYAAILEIARTNGLMNFGIPVARCIVGLETMGYHRDAIKAAQELLNN